mmetsp:Transcript_90213/g.160680  ORF Transcript_90213/g.160680 Transcript_90213/m.160680 type:complete len:243 (-) Transcript_90213:48-776(-)|eukprot:CAMPEP_0197659200 /NCGR_PEP_ID=MMETSP1338-20131121/46595_1 /TAXON_ID=43686 ORGANISM="Pelagodinium beii, Strain RCC1491" /NCGR_SAMPLE_ID=MMETSP1338 /ASSEMBLY_ACC=CAM_ASM_000754 /LENGTH=242 /DNA_ID=CAMNT_0043236003 /DNA_START=35 /DNA_END=763 /DNA_ORIENTATION=+
MKMALLSRLALLQALVLPIAGLLTADGKTPSKIEKIQQQTQKYEKEAEASAAEAAMWARKAYVASTDSGATQEKTNVAIRKRGVADWVAAAGNFKRILNDRTGAHANGPAGAASLPYVKAEMSYTSSQLQYAGAAAAFKVRAQTSQSSVKNLQAYADQYRMMGDPKKAELYAREAEDLAKDAEDAQATADKYDTVVDRIGKALPTIKKMGAMAAARARWAMQPFGGTAPQELVTLTVAPPLA